MSNAVTAPEPGKPQGATMQSFGTPGTFHGQNILNNQETGAFVNEQPRNNQAEQKAHQLNIQAAAGRQLERQHAEPAFSPINTRETGGVFTPDNSQFPTVKFGAMVQALRATTAFIPDLSDASVSIDGSALSAGNRALVKNGAAPSKYTAADVVATSNVNLAVTLDGVTIDGVALGNGDRVLLTAQTDPSENGLYTVATTPTVASRSTDMDAVGEVVFGKSIAITSGTVGTGKVYVVSEVPAALDTNDLGVVDVASAAGQAVANAFNGVYTVGTVGGGTAAFTRATDMDTADELTGAAVQVTSGTVNANNTFVQPSTVTTIDVDAAAFVNYTKSMPTGLTNKPGDSEKNSDSQVYGQA